MFAALAQRVDVLPSSTFFAGQHPPDDDAVAALLRDSRVSAPGCTAALPIAPPSPAPASNTAPASTAKPFVRAFTLPPRLQTFSIPKDLHERLSRLNAPGGPERAFSRRESALCRALPG